MSYQLTADQKAAFDQDGCVVIPGFFSPEETELLFTMATDDSVQSHTFDFNDQSGRATKLALWFTPGDDTFGLMSRSERMVGGVQTLLAEHSRGGTAQVCHFHSKVMQKQPRTGGAWEWHQDYGYWYKNGFLYPEALVSVMVALTDATIENGCLQVLKGSHKMQRFEHNVVGKQQGVDPEFLEYAKGFCEHAYVELKAGDVLFFHSNILHASSPNTSDTARWSIISCYNLDYNVPFREKHTSCIEPVRIVSDSALLASGKQVVTADDFHSAEAEITLQVS
jgi:hypothetical protein